MKLTATYKGLVTGILMVIASVISFYGMHLPVKGNTHYVVLGIFVIGLLWSLVSFKFSSNQTRTIKEYFSEGFKTFIVATLFMVVYTIVFYKLNPQIMETMLAENEILAKNTGNYTEMDIQNNTQKLRNIFMPMTIAITCITHLILGSIISLLGGAVLSQSNK